MLVNSLYRGHNLLVLHNLFLALVGEFLQQLHGVVAYFLIDLLIDRAEHLTCIIVPYPPQVVGNLVKTLQFLGKC